MESPALEGASLHKEDDHCPWCRLCLWTCSPTSLLQSQLTGSARQMPCKASWMPPLQSAAALESAHHFTDSDLGSSLQTLTTLSTDKETPAAGQPTGTLPRTERQRSGRELSTACIWARGSKTKH